MEQINQNTNTIVIDDGSKEYTIQNQRGEILATFRFRPADTNIIARYKEVQKFFSEFNPKKGESLEDSEAKIIEQMDYLMGADTGSSFFSVMGPFSLMADGKLFIEVCMNSLCNVINKEFDIRLKITQSGISKYTQKYQQNRPNYTKKHYNKRHGR